MLLLLVACAPAEPELLLTGRAYEGEQLSHRVSYLSVGIEDFDDLRDDLDRALGD